MQRFPNGVEKPGFYAKQAPEHFPEWIDRVSIEVLESGEKQPQVVINKPETLVYIVDQATITPHTWLSRTADLNRPDKLIFDLDPPKSFEAARSAARRLRPLLDELELPAYLMTTGSRGLHVGVPLDGQSDFDAVRDFARDLADALVARHPDELTTETRKAQRRGRLFLDYLRNAYAQTSVPPYAVRARSGAPVATPLTWDELDDPDLDSRRYHVGNIFERIEKVGDPWADFYDHGISLTAARRRLGKLASKTKG
jgi:bifunctional non-homologous end joining protein LigD